VRRSVLALATAVLWFSGAPDDAGAAEIKLLTPGALMSSLKVLIPQFESASGNTVAVTYASAFAAAERIKNGEIFDVAMMGDGSADELLKSGQLVAGSKVMIAKVGVGLFVRKGDPKPDISTYETFARTVMNAKAITYSDPALGGTASIYVADLLDSLDVTGSIKSKTKLSVQYRALNDFVANGNADFGLNQITEILADSRLELVGPLPETIQKYTYYAAAMVTKGGKADGSKALIDFLASPAAAQIMRSKGFEPL
jgi:molybdate transport system substrate-binding protein